ncbi:uncharacterized protein LOC131601684 [Vicia villosa]|uniref:uncharacterized protein LOC131601684 n=1 Tax=Vicia villosa TaxID=3911 RepID=UPI00273B44E0|nr:uncharacterized protein LOC131601684 [Vicia villosa]
MEKSDLMLDLAAWRFARHLDFTAGPSFTAPPAKTSGEEILATGSLDGTTIIKSNLLLKLFGIHLIWLQIFLTGLEVVLEAACTFLDTQIRKRTIGQKQGSHVG